MYYILLLMITHSWGSLMDSTCIQSYTSGTKTPDDELMNAFYVADPDPTTGYIKFNIQSFGNNQLSAQLEFSTLSYETWLTKVRDGHKDMANLWFYLARLITTDILELYGHYDVAARLGTRKSRGVIDFTKLYDRFNDVCSNFIKQTKWYYCFNKEFFCGFKDVLSYQRNVVMGTNLKSLTDINKMSHLGIDNNERGAVLEALFSATLLKYIPSTIWKDVFYQSRLVSDAIEELMTSKVQLRSCIPKWNGQNIDNVRRRMNAQCDEDILKTINQQYYCVGKRFIEIIMQCSTFSNMELCLFDPVVQDYFSRSRFYSVQQLNVLRKMLTKTQASLTLFKNKITAGNKAELQTLVNKYQLYVKVDVKTCTLNWMKRFDCTANFACPRNVPADIKFDCNGGFICRLNTMYRFDCMLQFLIETSKRLISTSMAVVAKQESTIWMSFPPISQYVSGFEANEIGVLIQNVQRSVKVHVMAYDSKELLKFIKYLPPYNLTPFWAYKLACVKEKVDKLNMVYCNFHPLLKSIHMFLTAFTNSNKKGIRMLNPTVNYILLIEQLQIERVQGYITAQMEYYFNDVTEQLKQNFGKLSTYFSSLAAYDKKKADADISYIDGKLTDFETQIYKLVGPIKKRFSLIFGLALGANIADVIQKGVQFGISVAIVANPVNKIFGDGGILDSINALNDLVQAGATTAKISQIFAAELPIVLKMGTAIDNGFESNARQLLAAKELIATLKNGESSEKIANEFLEAYNNYTPKVEKSQLSAYGSKFELIASNLCDAAFEGTTAAAAAFEIGLHSSGDCNKIGPDIVKLTTIYEEIYEFQFDLMDALSDAARASLATEKAMDMKTVYTTEARISKEFLSKNALNTFIISTLHVWGVVTEYCDALSYLNGGAYPSECKRVISVPSHSAVAYVLGLRSSVVCRSNNEIRERQYIPTKPKDTNDKAFIDLEKLYNSEIVEFKIPNFQWLKTNKWLANMDAERAMFIKQFELFLIPMSGSGKQTVELAIEHGTDNYLVNGGTKYVLPILGLKSRYTTRYNENTGRDCSTTIISNPYDLCEDDDLTTLCMTSNGIESKLYPPTIYNTWKIRATVLPANQVPPKPKTNFKLKADVTICFVDLANEARGKRRAPHMAQMYDPITMLTKRAANKCCAASQYWTGSNCQTCPAGSSQKLMGNYCQ